MCMFNATRYKLCALSFEVTMRFTTRLTNVHRGIFQILASHPDWLPLIYSQDDCRSQRRSSHSWVRRSSHSRSQSQSVASQGSRKVPTPWFRELFIRLLAIRTGYMWNCNLDSPQISHDVGAQPCRRGKLVFILKEQCGLRNTFVKYGQHYNLWRPDLKKLEHFLKWWDRYRGMGDCALDDPSVDYGKQSEYVITTIL